MSALEEYAEFKANVKPLDDPIQEAFEVYADAAIAELDAENKRLRCCGNCVHFDAEEFQYCSHPSTLDAGWDGDMPYYISVPDQCRFTPSRRAERETT